MIFKCETFLSRAITDCFFQKQTGTLYNLNPVTDNKIGYLLNVQITAMQGCSTHMDLEEVDDPDFLCEVTDDICVKASVTLMRRDRFGEPCTYVYVNKFCR